MRGPPDETAQNVGFTATVDQPALFAALPAIDPIGTLRFTPAPDANGTATITVTAIDDGGTTNGGHDTSTVHTATITINPINDAPTFTDGGDVTATEDDTVLTIAGWATSIRTGPTNEATQLIAFAVQVDQPALFETPPSITSAGTLTFKPAPDANGTATITVTAIDDGGTTNAGNDTSTVHTATITINPVNDPPQFTDNADITINEDSGPNTLAGWAHTIVPGPIDETPQTVAFTVIADQPALFAAFPAIDTAGTLTFTPAPDANGTATITVTAIDDGGTTNAGNDTSTPHTTTITINPVNDPPQFTDNADITINEDSGPNTLAGWAHTIVPGPIDETPQTVAFTVIADQPALFAAFPAIDTAGTLTFTPAPDANGTATITVTAIDDGGTTNAGNDTSTPHTATITINPVNDAVIAGDDIATVNEDDSAGVTVNALTNDTDADTDPLTVVSIDTTGIVGGSVTDLGNGLINYTPDPNFNGTETFTYNVSDGNSSDTATVTITVGPTADAPVATADAYTTAEDTTRVVAGPGLLANDYDYDADALTITPTSVAGPSNGTLILGTDGAFTYTPDNGFIGTDSFTYQLNDSSGLTATTTVTITVDSGLTAGGLYLGNTPTLGTWNMSVSPSANATPEPDFDFDGNPGITVAKDGLFDTRTWIRNITGTPLALNGPVTLELWSTIEDFQGDKDAHPEITLYDCDNLGLSCVTVGYTDTHISDYNAGVPDWVKIDISLGNIAHTFPAGRQLRLQLRQGHNDLWVATSGSRPSQLTYTLANTAPIAVNDIPPPILEDATATNFDVLANDTDTNLDPASITINTPPANGTANPLPDGTIDYQPDPDTNGPDSFTYQVCDTAGLCDTATVTITVTPVNDQPGFTAGSDIIANATDPPYSQAGWATGITTGPTNETSQTLAFTVTAADPSLFSVQPNLSSTGTLTFTPSGTTGATTITIQLTDNGGTTNGGNNTTTAQTALITLT